MPSLAHPRPAMMTRVTPVPVLFVSSHAKLGGAERYLEQLLRGLGAEWVNAVIALEDGPALERFRAAGARVEVIPSGRRAGIAIASIRLRHALRRHRPAVVHANGVKAALVAALSGTRIPIVWVKHDFSWDGALVRLISLRCRTVVAVSAAVGAAIGERARVIHNGVDVAPVDAPAGRAAVRRLAGGEGPVVALAGRLDPVKGQTELVEALPAVRRRHPGVRALLIGEAAPAHEAVARDLVDRIAALGLDDAVTITGWREDALDLLAGVDAVVVPTMRDAKGFGREGFGLVAVEAMAVGTPVIAYADGALREVLGDCARLVAPGDRVALADAVADVLDDERERRRISECGKARALERFTVPRMLEAMRAVYREAAGDRRPATRA
jgi:glycosyltransferase involved in cell wall biosynthesis